MPVVHSVECDQRQVNGPLDVQRRESRPEDVPKLRLLLHFIPFNIRQSQVCIERRLEFIAVAQKHQGDTAAFLPAPPEADKEVSNHRKEGKVVSISVCGRCEGGRFSSDCKAR